VEGGVTVYVGGRSSNRAKEAEPPAYCKPLETIVRTRGGLTDSATNFQRLRRPIPRSRVGRSTRPRHSPRLPADDRLIRQGACRIRGVFSAESSGRFGVSVEGFGERTDTKHPEASRSWPRRSVTTVAILSSRRPIPQYAHPDNLAAPTSGSRSKTPRGACNLTRAPLAAGARRTPHHQEFKPSRPPNRYIADEAVVASAVEKQVCGDAEENTLRLARAFSLGGPRTRT